MDESKASPDWHEVGRAASGLLTLVLALVLCQAVLLDSFGLYDVADPEAILGLAEQPVAFFLLMILTGILCGLAAVTFSRGPIQVLLTQRAVLGPRLYCFGSLATLLVGQAWTFWLEAMDLGASAGQTMIDDALAGASGSAVVLGATAICLTSPIGEELFFRGFLMDGLNRGMGRGHAIVLSAMCFGLIHFDPAVSIGATLMGVVLGALAVASGSLWPPVVCHVVNNTTALVLHGLEVPETFAVDGVLGFALHAGLGVACTLGAAACLVAGLGGIGALRSVFAAEPAEYGR